MSLLHKKRLLEVVKAQAGDWAEGRSRGGGGRVGGVGGVQVWGEAPFQCHVSGRPGYWVRSSL